MKKFVIYMSVFLSLFWITVPRHGDPVVSTVGRASIATPQIRSPFTISKEAQISFADPMGQALASYSDITVKNYLQAVHAKTVVKHATVIHTKQKTYTQTAYVSHPVNWDAMAQCESRGRWNLNTGNGFYGGLQWTTKTWNSVRISTDPSEAWRATREQQIAAAERLLASGVSLKSQWPVCSRYA